MTSSRTVVVTGASTGIGAATALRLDRAGWRVFAGVRREADGAALTATSSNRLTVLLVDVTDESSLAAAAATVSESVGGDGLSGLVNNAGIAVGGPAELIAMADWRRQFEVNVFGQIAATQAFLPLVRAATGRIVFTSSMAGIFSSPFLAPYSSSKHALEGFADSLRRELRPAGIRVTLVQPGAIATPIWDKAEDDAEAMRVQFGTRGEQLYPGMLDMLLKEVARSKKVAIPAEKVAAVIETALTRARPRTRYRIGVDAHGIVAADRVLPAPVLDRVVDRFLG